MVGAITVLIAIVAVFLAYNANKGLPFVPVYSVAVDVPNGARVTNANEIRIGGPRVGVIESIEPIVDSSAGQTVSVDSDETELPQVAARLNLKLDETAQPLPAGLDLPHPLPLGVRPQVPRDRARNRRSGRPEGFTFDGLDDGEICAAARRLGRRQFKASRDTAARTAASRPRTSSTTSPTPTTARRARRSATTSRASAAPSRARGVSLNDTIQELEPLFRYLGPVGAEPLGPSTRFSRLFPALARTANLVEPVAVLQAEQFAFAARTFEAISRDPEAYATGDRAGAGDASDGDSTTCPGSASSSRKFADLAIEAQPGHQGPALWRFRR